MFSNKNIFQLRHFDFFFFAFCFLFTCLLCYKKKSKLFYFLFFFRPRPKSNLSRYENFASMKEITTELDSDKASSNLKAYADVYAMGDGPHIDLIRKNNLNNSQPQMDITTNIKTSSSEFKNFRGSPSETFRKLDTKYVTIRPTEETYVLDGVVSSTVEKFELGQFMLNDMKPETEYHQTPLQSIKSAPRRKLSVYHRSFDVDSLQTPDSLQTTAGEKRRSVSTPDVQESDFPGFKSKAMPSFDTSVTKSQLLNTYRCMPNTSDSYDSPSPKNDESSTKELEDDSDAEEINKIPMKLSKPVVLAPTKFKLSNSTVNQTLPLQPESTNALLITPNKQLTRTYSDNYEAHHSKILSGSSDILKRQLSFGRCNITSAKTDLDSHSSSKSSTEQPSSPTADVPRIERSTDCSNVSGSVFLSGAENHKTFTKEEGGFFFLLFLFATITNCVLIFL